MQKTITKLANNIKEIVKDLYTVKWH